MKPLLQARERFRSLHIVCQTAVKVGLGLALCYFFTALFAYSTAGITPAYFRSILVFQEGIRASLTCLFVATLSLVVGDRMLEHQA